MGLIGPKLRRPTSCFRRSARYSAESAGLVVSAARSSLLPLGRRGAGAVLRGECAFAGPGRVVPLAAVAVVILMVAAWAASVVVRR
jgi:hypothetical protein